MYRDAILGANEPCYCTFSCNLLGPPKTPASAASQEYSSPARIYLPFHWDENRTKNQQRFLKQTWAGAVDVSFQLSTAGLSALLSLFHSCGLACGLARRSACRAARQIDL
jgi:hypothetical protein